MTRRFIVYPVIFIMILFLSVSFIQAQNGQKQELISLDLKGMDIRDVMKILSQKSGLNIVVNKDVKDTVSVYLKDVDVMEALDIIVSANNLAYEEEGSLIRIMTEKGYERLYGEMFRDRTKTEIFKLSYVKASDAEKIVGPMKTRVGKIVADNYSNTIILVDVPENIEKMKGVISEIDVLMVTEVFYLGYAQAEQIKDKLTQMVSEPIGSIRFDERTNTIVVRDIPKRIEDIKKVIDAFDEKIREVTIDANIIQVTLSDKYSYGINWDDVAKMGSLSLKGDINISAGLTDTPTSNLTIATTGGNHSTVINLLKTFGETNVLSRPRITVADREEAKILVGAREVYVTSEVTTLGDTRTIADNIQFVDVGVSLAVTPEINKEGYIKLKVKPEVSSTDATKTVTLLNDEGNPRAVIPYVTTSEAETTVMVKDNTTLIIGGLMKDTIIDRTEKVPFLGDIPILGKLFSTTGKSKEKTELVIFLTPRIIEGDEGSEEIKPYLDKWEGDKIKPMGKRDEDDIEKKEIDRRGEIVNKALLVSDEKKKAYIHRAILEAEIKKKKQRERNRK